MYDTFIKSLIDEMMTKVPETELRRKEAFLLAKTFKQKFVPVNEVALLLYWKSRKSSNKASVIYRRLVHKICTNAF